MSETTWARVLQAVYDSEDTNWRTSLQESTDMSDETVQEGLAFLERHGLIEDTDNPVLTEKGFRVARNREMQRSQFEMNLFLAAFTFILSLAIVMQAFYQLHTMGTVGWILGGTLLAGTFITFYLLERRTAILHLLIDGR
jgi:predicted transcriptional regulator